MPRLESGGPAHCLALRGECVRGGVMLSRFRWQVRGLAGRIRQLSLGLSVCRPSARAEIHSPPGPAGCSLPPWIGPRSPLFLYLDCPAGSAKRDR